MILLKPEYYLLALYSINILLSRIIKNSKYSAAIKSLFQPENPIKSAFRLCAVQSSKV